MLKGILIINGHPNGNSFCSALGKAYKDGALEGDNEVRELSLAEMKFNPILKGYGQTMEFEQDLQRAQEFIKWSDHIVFTYPTWWGTMPALLKGFVDRVFSPGFAFKYTEGPLPEKLLKGRSARLIVTMDSPKWYYNIVYGKPGHNAMKRSTLKFCGINPVKITTIGPISQSTDDKRQVWLKEIKQLGISSA
ncbi:NAD(P)H-dependent oxidoreductase [Bacillus sp. SM2101]|uniref:NAD(P)H-dependent oxidoreductase n=1 Tax=Bacillus sp. SM2101 TaxID=2805366 RepID=UPI001BDEA6F9